MSNVPRWRGQGVEFFDTYVILVSCALREFYPPPSLRDTSAGGGHFNDYIHYYDTASAPVWQKDRSIGESALLLKNINFLGGKMLWE
jgi:hypothetical protein